ncbi:helix-turn-helix domain-containing protein [Psychromonas aquimarina]|uniref:helix-turn-helix domain-containing protein n=1 Tax=Psychromonas aquimarina TaxID=444919 RepID=UPI00041F6886|nr:helix-turn-helix domain-containing protein [Psychromonas aquimarina]
MTFQSILNIILPHCQIHKYPANHVLKDNSENKLCFLLKGRAYSLIKNDRQKKPQELILFDLNPGDFFGDLIFSSEREVERFDSCVKSTKICEVAEISYDKLKNIIISSPAVLLYLSDQLAVRMNNYKARLIARDRPLAVRTQQLLETLLDGPHAVLHPDGVQIKISRKEIGARLGTSALRVSKALSLLKSQKIITVRGKSQNIVLLGARPE